jgi:hypothetical protein
LDAEQGEVEPNAVGLLKCWSEMLRRLDSESAKDLMDKLQRSESVLATTLRVQLSQREQEEGARMRTGR